MTNIKNITIQCNKDGSSNKVNSSNIYFYGENNSVQLNILYPDSSSGKKKHYYVVAGNGTGSDIDLNTTDNLGTDILNSGYFPTGTLSIQPFCIDDNGYKEVWNVQTYPVNNTLQTDGSITPLPDIVTEINNKITALQNEDASDIPIVNEESHFESTNVEGALEELFTYANDGKTNIASAITNKGVQASPTDSFPTLATKIGQITSSGWQPASDWIDISNPADGTINFLVADTQLSTYAFTCTTSAGQYQVNWGDGTTTLHNSGSTAQHTYTVGSGKPCSRGYTTFKITVSPTTGNITNWRIKNHSLSNQYFQLHDYLWCVSAARYITSTVAMFYYIDAGGTGDLVWCYALESFKQIYPLTLNTASYYMFYRCISLQDVSSNCLTGISDANHMFSGCSKLSEVNLTNAQNITNASYMFESCGKLKKVRINGCSSITNASYMFTGCGFLDDIIVTDMVNINNASSMFNNCTSLTTIDISQMTNINNASYMFNNCTRLNSINLQGITSITNTTNMFSSCLSLQTINISSLINVTDATSMFSTCYALRSVDATNFAANVSSVNLTNTFYQCEALNNINLPNAKISKFTMGFEASRMGNLKTLSFSSLSTFGGTSPQIDISYHRLSASQINTIFTALPTVSGKTIKITGCTGADSCNKSIATAKGWTVSTT